MKKVPAKRTVFPEEELDFERERILNLIGSRIRRKDLEIAQKLAEDLYNVEIEFALHHLIRKLKRSDRLVFLIFILTLPVLLASLTFTVLGLHPSFYLLVFAAALIFILSFIVVNAIFVRRFKREVVKIIDAYETKKRNFVVRLIERFTDCCGPDAEGASFSLEAIKRDMQQWLVA